MNAKLRKEKELQIARTLSDFFMASGVEYTCAMVVRQTIEREAERLSAGYPDYKFSTRRLVTLATEIVHLRTRP